jgi:hypothetical protein
MDWRHWAPSICHVRFKVSLGFLPFCAIANDAWYGTPVAELKAHPTTAPQRPGTLEQLRVAVCEEKAGRILNMLDLPMGHSSQDPPPQYRYISFALAMFHQADESSEH